MKLKPNPRNPHPRAASRRPPQNARPNVALRDNGIPPEQKLKDAQTPSKPIFDLATVTPLQAASRCRNEISAMRSGFTKERRRHLAEAYAIASVLEYSEPDWRKFIEHEFWEQRDKRPKMDDVKRPLLFVMVFVFDAIDRTRYRAAWRYAKALKAFWADDIPAREVEAKIKEAGGIEKLYRASAPKQTKKKKRSESLKLIDTDYRVWRALGRLREGKKARLIIERVPEIHGFHKEKRHA